MPIQFTANRVLPDASFGSTTTLLTGTCGRSPVALLQLAPPLALRATCGPAPTLALPTRPMWSRLSGARPIVWLDERTTMLPEGEVHSALQLSPPSLVFSR